MAAKREAGGEKKEEKGNQSGPHRDVILNGPPG